MPLKPHAICYFLPFLTLICWFVFALTSPFTSLHVAHLVCKHSNCDHFNNVCLDTTLFIVMKAL